MSIKLFSLIYRQKKKVTFPHTLKTKLCVEQCDNFLNTNVQNFLPQFFPNFRGNFERQFGKFPFGCDFASHVAQ